MKHFLFCLAFFLSGKILDVGETCAAPVFLPFAHSHNDYEHRRPLAEALENGFGSVEADVWLVDGQLLVAHDHADLKPDRTLESLYLDPLKERISKNGGTVYRGTNVSFHLLIDVKSEAEPAYKRVKEILVQYSPLLKQWEETAEKGGPVTVILSGNRAISEIVQENHRFLGIDGRLKELDGDKRDLLFYPWISDSWKNVTGENSTAWTPAVRQKIRTFAERVKKAGASSRIWGAPDNADSWQELRQIGVDWISTDKIVELNRHFTTMAER